MIAHVLDRVHAVKRRGNLERFPFECGIPRASNCSGSPKFRRDTEVRPALKAVVCLADHQATIVNLDRDRTRFRSLPCLDRFVRMRFAAPEDLLDLVQGHPCLYAFEVVQIDRVRTSRKQHQADCRNEGKNSVHGVHPNCSTTRGINFASFWPPIAALARIF